MTNSLACRLGFAPVLLLGFLVGSVAVVPAMGAEVASVPNLSGAWGRNSLAVEVPTSGPGPVVNLAPRLSNGMPDLNTLIGDYDNPILKPDAAAQLRRMGEISRNGGVFSDAHNSCWPEPVPYILYNFQIEILQESDQVTILYMEDHEVRRIRLNASHPERPPPSYYGDSVGHYEGDTLVVDTVGVKAGHLAYVDQYGTPYSQSLHVVERYRLIDAETARAAIERHEAAYGRVGPGFGGASIDADHRGRALQIEFTVEDQGVFTMPWSALATYRRASSTWEERVCAENLHDYATGEDTKVPTAEVPDF